MTMEASETKQIECEMVAASGLRVKMPNGDVHEHVRPAYAAPLSHPGQFVSLINMAGQEIVMIRDLSTLAPETRQAIEQELQAREMTSRIEVIESIREEFEIAYWLVRTHRGPREFVTREIHECVRQLAPQEKYVITDVEGNRYEIEDLTRMDAKSQALFRNIIA